MGRGKRRRKYMQKKKRMEKAKRGKLVRFDLQNSKMLDTRHPLLQIATIGMLHLEELIFVIQI